jgi:hypothetical protein
LRIANAIKAFLNRDVRVHEQPAPEPKKTQRDPIARIELIPGRKQDFDRELTPVDFDIARIDALYKNEAFVRRAVDKHIELMFKAGWDFIGDNPRIVDYINKRLKLIAEMTRIPTNQLFVEIAEDLVKYSNAVVIKVRKNITWPKGLVVRGINGKQPVVGYFPVNLNYVQIERDSAGNVYKWVVNFPGNTKPLELKPEDVVHFYYKRDKNQVFAMPYLVSVIEDINALRQVEENVLKLIYRNLYPFLHHIIGLDREGYGGTDEEVQAAKQMIENMDLEAGLVTTERHKIVPIALDNVIDANNYLRYFEQRVFTGLGVSETVMGRSGSASRATAESQYFDLRETVKAMQRVMESFINEFIIKELLMEGGYDPLLNPKDAVYFRFREIDLDMKIKYENHIIYQYITNCITEDEMRAELGRDPITDRAKLFYNLVTIPVAQSTGKKVAVSPSDVVTRTQPQTTPSAPGKPGRKGKAEEAVSPAELMIDVCERASVYGDDAPEVAKEAALVLIESLVKGEGMDIDTAVEAAYKKVAGERRGIPHGADCGC